MEMQKITSGTVARTVVLILALINQILVTLGYSVLPIDDVVVEELISTLFTTGAALVAWWKNNSFTSTAIEADRYMNELKSK